MKGRVIKGIGGFYFVETSEGIFRAKGRGLLKKDAGTIVIGDMVEAVPPEEGEDDGLILEIFPRKNSFHRPPISNLDRIIVICCPRDPEPNLEVIDKLLIMAESKNTHAILCINKADLDTEGTVDNLKRIYGDIYPVVVTSAKTGEGIEELSTYIKDINVAFAGPSGVGKSSLTNALVPKANMETGDISLKTSRGKHTTRHVEIFSVNGGYLYDTPGFTSFDLKDIKEDELGNYFPEIRTYSGSCRFSDCYHLEEPDCGVREAVERGEISQERYSSYKKCLDDIRKQKRR